jgi:leader peptidase (prepilin peptidase)/N-methyltransferase
MLLYWLLIALALLDVENLWLPDWITLPGIASGFAFVVLHTSLLGLTPRSFHLTTIGLDAIFDIFGILVAAGLILLIRWSYWLIRRREGVGLGDAKLMALLAAWLGLPNALLAFGIGISLAALAAIVLIVLPATRKEPASWSTIKLPLGTFLCIGGIISSLCGGPIWAAYLRWDGL